MNPNPGRGQSSRWRTIAIVFGGLLLLLILARVAAIRRERQAQSVSTPSATTVTAPSPSSATTPSAAKTTTPGTPVPSTAQLSTPTTPACQVKSVDKVTSVVVEDWSRQTGQILTNPKDSGTYQVHLSNLDGSNNVCVTCSSSPGAPPSGSYKIMPRFDATGKWIILAGEIPNNPLRKVRASANQEAALINGWFANAYVTNPQGTKWYNLTNYTTDQGIVGVLGAQFSNDDKEIVWSRVEAAPDKNAPLGHWHLMLADVTFDESGMPNGIANPRDITPAGNGTFFEPFGFTADNQGLLITSDLNTSPYGFDLYVLNTQTREVQDLTKTPNVWDEHGAYSPSFKLIAWMSSLPYASGGAAQVGSLKTDEMLMTTDGTNLEQITHFNTPGYPEYSSQRTIAGRSMWNGAGTQLIVDRLHTGLQYPNEDAWLVTFSGPCGA